MKVTVDPTMCTGTGYCVRIAPAIFEMAGDKAVVVRDELADAAQVALAEEAETLCPGLAVEVVDSER